MSVVAKLLPVVIAVVLASPSLHAAEVSGGSETTRAFSVRVVGSGHQPMILIPGLLSSGEVWDSVVAHFSDTYQIHVVTLAGFAGVQPVADLDGRPSLLSRVRDDLIAYVRAEGLAKPVLVGHSLGATLAMWVASEAPAAIGPVVAVDGAPFVSALLNPRTTAADMMGQAEQLRARYRSLLPDQLEMHTRTALQAMVTDPAEVGRLAAWARRSDPATAGQALYDLMTTDLRPTVGRIQSDLLLVAAGKAFAANASALDAVTRAYDAQVSGVSRHTVIVAARALHFVMLDDPEFLLSAMDSFLNGSGRR